MSVTDRAPRRLGISQLLEPDHPLKLPHFQRSYAWKEKRQVQEYWDDLKSAVDGPGGPLDYFMGLVVIDADRRIHDGQQRLATTLIFVQELYATAKTLAKDDPKHDPDLFDELNAIVAPLNSPARPVLEISPTDQAALLNRVGIAAALPESTVRLRAARRKLRALLDEELAPLGTNSRLGRILEWAQLLKEKAYVVELEVPSQVAHSIFETMNTRGVQLSNGDLVKSFLLARAKNINAAQQLWSQIITALADSSGAYEDNLDDFLYHYCGSRYARTSKEQLFRVFSDHTKDAAPLDVLEELRVGAELYAGLIDPFGAPALKDYGDEAKYAIQFLNGAKLRQLRYLLLAALSDYGAEAASAKKRRNMQEDLIVKVAGWSIRGLVDGRTGGQSAQTLYVSAASAIRMGAAKAITDVRGLFTDKRMFIENDADFKVAFRAQRFDNQQAKAVLYELERAALGSSAALGLREELTLEHVLPQSIPAAGTWTQFTADERAIYARRLGNMLLLAQPFNSSLGNLEWPDKKKKITAVKDSQTPLTVAALRFRQWSKNTIDTRTVDLANAAAAHWAS